ncbi:MAG: OmpA family protein [Saprospirales bacterium]|nr:MAG: OmpA family protein [Saprospirales bacterium]
MYKKLKNILSLSLIFVAFVQLNGQKALILDADNSTFFIEKNRLIQLNEKGDAFSAIEVGEELFWISYEGKSIDKTHFFGDGSGFKLFRAPLSEVLTKSPQVLNTQSWNPLNSDQAMYGPVSVADDHGFVFFTATQKKSVRGQSNNLGIFMLTGLNASGRATQLPFIDNRFSYCHPAWDVKDQRLYFSSDLDNPSGRMNLFFSQYHAGGWSHPVRLEIEGVSSNSNEVFAFVNEKGLFFSSDKSGGMGGLDIYFAKSEGDGFSEPKALAPPFNSVNDDFGIWFSNSNSRGYFSSNRKFNKDAVYAFNCQGDCFTPVSVVKSLDLTIKKTIDLSPIRGAKVHLLPESQLLKEIESGNLQLAADGGLIGIGLPEEWGDHLSGLEAATGREGKVLLEKRSIEKVFYVLVKKENYLPLFKRVKFEDGFSHLFLEWEMVPDCFPVSFSFVSETGSLDGLIDIELKETDAESSNFKIDDDELRLCLLKNRSFILTAESEGFDITELEFQTSARDPESHVIFLRTTEREEVSEGTVLELRNIYYEYNSHEIVQEAAKELDELAAIMKLDTSMIIELRAHTDSRGSTDYNLQLSSRRAESARDYLLNLDIAPERILTSGRGHSELRNHCKPGVQCTEEEHAFNRRTEVFVVRAGSGIQAIRDGSGGVLFFIE